MRGVRSLWAAVLALFIISVGIINAGGSPMPSMYIDPESSSGLIGSIFAVDLMVENVAPENPPVSYGCFAWQAYLQWDPAVLNVTSWYDEPNDKWLADITWGDFLADQPGGTTQKSETNFDYGILEFGQTTMGDYPGVSGSGWLATVEFKILANGNTTLDIASAYKWPAEPPYGKTFLYNRYMEDIEMLPLNAYFVHRPSPMETDLNADGRIDMRDLARVAIKYGEGPDYVGPEDITGEYGSKDGYVDIWDLNAVAQDYGTAY